MITNNNKNRARALSVIFFLMIIPFVIVLCKVIYLKTSENDFWEKRANEWNISKHKVSAKRGNVYAIDNDSGEQLLLATSLRYWDLYLDLGKGKVRNTNSKKDTIDWIISQKEYNQKIGQLCSQLSSLFKDKSAKEYKSYFDKQRKKENRYVLIHKDVTEQQLEQMKRFSIVGRVARINKSKKDTTFVLSGVMAKEPKFKRVYPYGEMARRTIGIQVKGETAGCDTCYDGIDGYYTNKLSGVHGYRWERRINPNQWVPVDNELEIKVEDGLDVISTIDVSLQELAETALLRCLDSNQAESGTVVLMETHTGHIKALANFTKQKDDSYRETENIAISNRFEPGSTFKIVTAMMLLDKGLADTSDIVPTGVKHFPNTIKDIKDVGKVRHGDVSFRRALEMSSNVGISSLIYDLYCKDRSKRPLLREDLMQYFNYDKLNCDLALHEPLPIIRKTIQVDDLLRMSFGYVTAMTPLQMLTFYNGIANNGKVMKPQFVQSVAQDGKIVETFEPVVLKQQMCKKETLAKIQDVLKRVVLYGTGRKLRNTSYGIAGKSGTAEIGYDNQNQVLRHRASFVGYFPADQPQYSCIVVISKPHKALTHGGDLAAPVFRELSDRVIGTSKFYYPQKNQKVESLMPVMTYGNAKNYSLLCKNLGFSTPKFETLWIKNYLAEGKLNYSNQPIRKYLMPNVVGLSIRDAVYMLENMGLNVAFVGYGRVISQSIAKGQYIHTGQDVLLELASNKEKKDKSENTSTATNNKKTLQNTTIKNTKTDNSNNKTTAKKK